MNRKDVERYLKRLKVEVVDELNGWVRCKCPFSFWKHDSRSDNEQRFGVTHDEDEASYFNCFVCGEKGPFYELPARLGRMLKTTDLDKIGKQIQQDEILGGVDTVFGDWDDEPEEKRSEVLKVTDFPSRSEYLQHPSVLTEPLALRYLAKRNITIDTAMSLGLRYDVKRERILFPVIDYWTGRYIGCSGRLVWTEARRVREEERGTARLAAQGVDKKYTIPKVRDYSGLEKRLAFLGGYDRPRVFTGTGAAHPKTRPNGPHYWIIVEGLLAYARLCQLGFRDNTLAILGSAMTPGKVEILKDSGRALYYFVDPDAGGSKCLYGSWDEERQQHKGGGALDMLYGEMLQYVPDWGDVTDPDDLESKEQVLAMIESAKLYTRSR